MVMLMGTLSVLAAGSLPHMIKLKKRKNANNLSAQNILFIERAAQNFYTEHTHWPGADEETLFAFNNEDDVSNFNNMDFVREKALEQLQPLLGGKLKDVYAQPYQFYPVTPGFSEDGFGIEFAQESPARDDARLQALLQKVLSGYRCENETQSCQHKVLLPHLDVHAAAVLEPRRGWHLRPQEGQFENPQAGEFCEFEEGKEYQVTIQNWDRPNPTNWKNYRYIRAGIFRTSGPDVAYTPVRSDNGNWKNWWDLGSSAQAAAAIVQTIPIRPNNMEDTTASSVNSYNPVDGHEPINETLLVDGSEFVGSCVRFFSDRYHNNNGSLGQHVLEAENVTIVEL